MNKLEIAARQALEALREYRDTQMISAPRKAIEALREALDHSGENNEMAQEPVGVVAPNNGIGWRIGQEPLPPRTKLYTQPVRTKDLTDEELWEAAKTAKSNDLTDAFRAVITADREKNK